MIGVGINLKTLELLSKYLNKKTALKLAKELTVQEYEIRQDLKNIIIREFKTIAKPEFTVPGSEKLPANTIALIDGKYDYQQVLEAYKNNEVEFVGIPKEYLN